MDIQVVYSDFNEVLKSAKIELPEGKYVDVRFEDVVSNAGTPEQIIVKKLNVSYSDGVSSIDNKMSKDELKDYITLLQKAFSQMQ